MSMINQRDYQVVKGDIAEYQGDSIVVPAWTNLHTGNAISQAVNDKLRTIGVNPEVFWSESNELRRKLKKAQLGSAYYFKATGLQGVDSYILAVCYADKNEKDIPIDKKAALVTGEVLKEAGQHSVRSIAFPIMLSGDQGGKLEEMVPAMVTKFQNHLATRNNPKDITLYAFSDEAYQAALVMKV